MSQNLDRIIIYIPVISSFWPLSFEKPHKDASVRRISEILVVHGLVFSSDFIENVEMNLQHGGVQQLFNNRIIHYAVT